jgi:hypothetical protein
MEAAAGEVVAYLYERMLDKERGGRACVLVRFYKTHRFDQLEPGLRKFAESAAAGHAVEPTTRCLTLLATIGDRPEWCSRRASAGHQAIPLVSEQVVARLPMIAQLVSQLGLDVASVLRPDPRLMVDLDQRMFNVFHVENALGSPHIPAQADFVAPFEVKSVLGFGGLFPSGDLFATIMFSRVTIEAKAAQLLKPLALSVKLALLPHAHRAVFQGAS